MHAYPILDSDFRSPCNRRACCSASSGYRLACSSGFAGLGWRPRSRCCCRSRISSISTPIVDHHACRHLVRFDVWRPHHLDPASRAWRVRFVMVAIDGYELTKQGRVGVALGISMFSAFIAGMFGLLGLSSSRRACRLRPEFWPAGIFRAHLARPYAGQLSRDFRLSRRYGDRIRTFAGTVGLDPARSTARFTFGSLTFSPASIWFRW